MRKDLAIALVITVSFATFEARAQASYPCDNMAPNPYKLVSYDWGEGIQPWGGVRAVSVDSHDNLWAFSRCGDGDVHGDISQSCTGTKHAPVYELAPDGKMITHFGAGLFPGGHGIGVDSDGNVWAAEGLHCRADCRAHWDDSVTKSWRRYLTQNRPVQRLVGCSQKHSW